MKPSSNDSSPSSFGATLRLLVICGFVYHFAACACVAFLPSSSPLRRALPSAVLHYLRVTGNENRWDMFETAPRYHSFDVELMVRSRGKEYVFGAMLPGLSRYDGSLRAHKLFSNLSRESNAIYRRTYLGSALRTIEAEHHLPVERIWLRYKVGRTLRPAAIRKTGQLAVKEQFDRGM